MQTYRQLTSAVCLKLVYFVLCHLQGCFCHRVLPEAALQVEQLQLRRLPNAEVALQQDETSNTCASHLDEVDALVADNLRTDLAYWQGKRPLNIQHLDNLVRLFPQSDVKRLILIYNGNVYFPNQTASVTRLEGRVNKWLHHVWRALRKYAKPEPAGLGFPNALFYVNVADEGICSKAKNLCQAPILSLVKRIKTYEELFDAPPASDIDTDILFPLPVEKWAPQPLWSFPMHKKVHRAVFRGTPFCSGPPHKYVKCSRVHLANLTYYGGGFHMGLDVGLTSDSMQGGITDPLTGSLVVGPLPRMEGMPMQEHARYRYLLNLDGLTASYRLAKLMHLNSPVLKQDSMWGEYYYRSLRDGEHYIRIFRSGPNDVLDVIERYRDKDQELQRIADNAQRFAARYLCMRARMLYLKRLLQEYMLLFEDMEHVISTQLLPRLLPQAEREEAAAAAERAAAQAKKEAARAAARAAAARKVPRSAGGGGGGA